MDMMKPKHPPYRKIINTKDKHCIICSAPELCVFDTLIFYRKMTFFRFLDYASDRGYIVPKTDFERHKNHHIIVAD